MSSPVLNKVRERLLFLSPTVQAGWEPESRKEDFEEIKLLGQGAFGKVVKVSHKKTNIVYAMKIVEKAMLKQTNMVEQMVNEVKIMYSLNHPYILKLYNHFEDDLKIYLVLEIAPGGQLYAVLWKQPQKKFNEKTSAKFILQLTLALENVHSKSIIHRDIKPENLLLDEQANIKVADFGWSNFLKPDEVRQTFCGTLDYLAPEMLDRSHKHDHTVDIWSIGVLTFELLTGMSPFAPRENQNNAQYVDKYTKDAIKNVKFTFVKDFPEAAKDLVEKILVKDPKGRLTCEQIRTHPWIKENTKDVKIPASITMELEKRQIVKSSEVDTLQKEGKVAFTNEEIYQYSRPDSILVKEVKKDDKYVEQLNQKVKTLEAKLLDLDLDNKKKQAEIDSLKQQVEVLKSSGNVSQDLVSFQNKLKIADDRYLQEKTRYDQEVKKNMEFERKIKELENTAREANDLKEQVASLKQKNKQQKDEIEKLKLGSSGQSNASQAQQFGGGDGIDQLLSQLKQKHS